MMPSVQAFIRIGVYTPYLPRLHLSKGTLYSYLRHRGVEIGPYKKSMQQSSSAPASESGNADQPKIATILLTLRIESNSKFVRGKKRTIEHVESFYLEEYDPRRRPNGEYELKVPYDTDEDLDEAVSELLSDIACDAGDRHCFSESEARMEGTDRHWCCGGLSRLAVPLLPKPLFELSQ